MQNQLKLLLLKIRRVLLRNLAKIPLGAQHHCVVCNSRVQRFMPYRNGWKDVPALLRELDVIGSDVAAFSCPVCKCHDRERHLFFYLTASQLLDKIPGSTILHIAPETYIAQLLVSKNPAIYIQGDLYPTNDRIKKINIEKTDFSNDYFDLVIANHILEHVCNDKTALKELHRIIKPGGYAILQTPYSAKLTAVFSDTGIDTDSGRLNAYGQEDHVRLYGANLEAFIASFGFQSLVSSHNKLLPHVDPKRTGTNIKEPFFLFQKPFER